MKIMKMLLRKDTWNYNESIEINSVAWKFTAQISILMQQEVMVVVSNLMNRILINSETDEYLTIEMSITMFIGIFANGMILKENSSVEGRFEHPVRGYDR